MLLVVIVEPQLVERSWAVVGSIIIIIITFPLEVLGGVFFHMGGGVMEADEWVVSAATYSAGFFIAVGCPMSLLEAFKAPIFHLNLMVSVRGG